MYYCSCWFSTPPERSSGWRAETKRSVLWEKLAEQVFRELDIFWSRFYEPNSCISSYLGKHQNPSWWHLLHVVTFMRLAATFYWTYVLDCMYSPFTKITYILTSPRPASLEQFLRALRNAVSRAAVLILPQIKLNSQHSCCAFFFK